MGAQMYQEGRNSKSGRGRSYQARIRITSCSSNRPDRRARVRTRIHSEPTMTGCIGRRTVSVYVFTGPTISPTEARRELEAVYLPPAAEGDVYRVALKRPEAIGIIDGYFQSTPTVR